MCVGFVKGFVKVQGSAKLLVHWLEPNAAWQYWNYNSNSTKSIWLHFLCLPLRWLTIS